MCLNAHLALPDSRASLDGSHALCGSPATNLRFLILSFVVEGLICCGYAPRRLGEGGVSFDWVGSNQGLSG